MNIHVDTLAYTNDRLKAGIERPHAEAIARLQARTVGDLIEHELVTKDTLKADLSDVVSMLREEIRNEATSLREEIRNETTSLREEIRNEATATRRQMDGLMLQIRSLQMGSVIAAFAISAVIFLSRLIR